MELCWDAQPPAAPPRLTTTPTPDIAPKRARLSLSTAVTLNNVQEQLLFLDRYRVLVCKEHRTAIQNVDVHLRSQHAAVASTDRKAVVEYCRRWQVARPQDVELPPPLGPLIKELGEPQDAFQCQHDGACSSSFITVSKDMLQKHCKREHGKAWKDETSTLYNRVKVQTFFRTGGLQRYFVVDVADSSDDAPRVPRKVASVVSERLAEWKLTKHAHEEKAQVMDAQVAKTDKTGWFKRTGWLEHYLLVVFHVDPTVHVHPTSQVSQRATTI